MAETTHQKRSAQSTRMAVSQQRAGGRVLEDNRAAKQLTPEKPIQRVKEKEEPLQGKFESIQRIEEEEEPLQGKFASEAPAQLEQQAPANPNNTALPDNLKSGIENLSYMSMDHVKVHYNSSKQLVPPVAKLLTDPDSANGEPELTNGMDRSIQMKRIYSESATSSGSSSVVQLVRKKKKRKMNDIDSGSEADDEESDDEYVERTPRQSSKKKNPGSNIKKGTYNKTGTTLEYETESGAKHSEVWDGKSTSNTTVSTGLHYSGPEFRNPAHRPKNDYQVHNHYGLSPGQNSRNQNVVSHNTPSWAGFQAGGLYGNNSFTSARYNSAIEAKEKEWRAPVANSNKPFEYKTETHYEDIDSDDAEDIAPQLNNKKWDEARIRNRLRNVKRFHPDAKRVKKEKREIKYHDGKKKSFQQDRDRFAFIPPRAYDKKAHEKYIKARGQDSEGSDAELEKKKPKKRKREESSDDSDSS